MNRVLIFTLLLVCLLSDIFSQERIIKNDCGCLDTLHEKMDRVLKDVIGNKRYKEICEIKKKMKKKILIIFKIDTTRQIQIRRIISNNLLTRDEIDSLFKYYGLVKQEPCEYKGDMPEYNRVKRTIPLIYVTPLPLCEELEKLEEE